MEQTPTQERIDHLCRLLADIQEPQDIKVLLEDLCTRKEVENMAERVFAAKLLMQGNTYNQVMSRTSISSATLSRVSRCVQDGAGYSRLLKTEE